MKINNYSVLDNPQTKAKKCGIKDDTENKKSENPDSKLLKGDKVMLSDRSKLILKAQELLSKTPDSRAEKVTDLKKRILEGTYNISGEVVADALIRSHLQEII